MEETPSTSTSTSTSKIEKKTSEINEIQKIKNKEENKIKTINVISLEVDKQVLFWCHRQINDEEAQRNYLQNLKKINSRKIQIKLKKSNLHNS